MQTISIRLYFAMVFVGTFLMDTHSGWAQELPSKVIGVSAGAGHTCLLSPSTANCFGGSFYGEGDRIKGFVNARKIVSSYYGNCVLDDEGVWCWGFNFENSEIPKMDRPKDIAASTFFYVALDDEGVKFWGFTQFSDLLSPIAVEPNTNFVAAGTLHFCAGGDWGVKCWGANDNRQTTVPVGIGKVRALAASLTSTCALHGEKITCWGAINMNEKSQAENLFGNINKDQFCTTTKGELACFGDNSAPIQFRRGQQVGFGYNHVCVLDGINPLCRGANSFSQTAIPRRLTKPLRVAVGDYHTCIEDSQGIECWGYNLYEQAQSQSLIGAQALEAHSDFTCTIVKDELVCWGITLQYWNLPQAVGPSFKTLAIGTSHLCLLDDKVHCYGNNILGQTEPPKLNNPRLLAVGDFHSCAADRDGVKCWGFNLNGQTQVPEVLKNVTGIAAGSSSSCAIADSRVVCWGKMPEVPMPTFVNPALIKKAGDNTCVLDDNGLQCWGGNLDVSNVPKNLGTVRYFDVSLTHACAIDDTGVKCWGQNSYGQSQVRGWD